MYDFRNYRAPDVLYGEATKGWHNARTYRGDLRNRRSKNNKEYQYIKLDFHVLDEHVLVPAFFFYQPGQKEPDQLLGKMCAAVGLKGDYTNDKEGFFKALVGTELRVKVAHKYKKAGNSKVRRDQVVDFEPLLSQDHESDDEEQLEGWSEQDDDLEDSPVADEAGAGSTEDEDEVPF